MNDYSVKITVRNGRILKAMEEKGFRSQAELARAIGRPLGSVNSVIAMRLKPMREDGEWKSIVRDIAAALGLYPEEMFTERQMEGVKRNTVERYMGEERVLALTSANSLEDRTLDKLTAGSLIQMAKPREQVVIRSMIDGATFDEAAEDLAQAEGSSYPLSKERVRQIYLKGIRRIKSATRNQKQRC